MSTPTATTLAHSARLGLITAPWTVRPHPEPQGRQHPWPWACDTAGCEHGGQGVNEIDAHHQAAEHHLSKHSDKEPTMTDLPYTDADLRMEAASQYHAATRDHDFMGIGEQMTDGVWQDLSEDDFDAARDKIDTLLTNAADVSQWAIALGAAGLKPVTEIGFRLTTGGYSVAVQIAVDPDVTDDAREELVRELTEVINATASRVLGCKPVTHPA